MGLRFDGETNGRKLTVRFNQARAREDGQWRHMAWQHEDQ
jgi:hypothetical protein